MRGARSEGAEGERLTSSCSITPGVILLIMQIKCPNSSQDVLSRLAFCHFESATAHNSLLVCFLTVIICYSAYSRVN